MPVEPKQDKVNDREADRDKENQKESLRKVVERQSQRAARPVPTGHKQQKGSQKPPNDKRLDP
jgi:hypothetical protein